MIKGVKGYKETSLHKVKATTINGYLVKFDEDGGVYRLNGEGKWTEITTKQLYHLIERSDIFVNDDALGI
jgi:hypothetical protein